MGCAFEGGDGDTMVYIITLNSSVGILAAAMSSLN
jgi:hypothetical protein